MAAGAASGAVGAAAGAVEVAAWATARAVLRPKDHISGGVHYASESKLGSAPAVWRAAGNLAGCLEGSPIVASAAVAEESVPLAWRVEGFRLHVKI